MGEQIGSAAQTVNMIGYKLRPVPAPSYLADPLTTTEVWVNPTVTGWFMVLEMVWWFGFFC